MARSGIHPDYHSVKIVRPDGTHFFSMSTIGEVGSTILLENDISTHPAWRLDDVANYIDEKSSNVAKFRQKYGSFNFSGFSANKEAVSDDTMKDSSDGAEGA